MHYNLVGFILRGQSLIHYQQIINIIHYISNLKEKMYKVMFINARGYLVSSGMLLIKAIGIIVIEGNYLYIVVTIKKQDQTLELSSSVW